jgi:hypothetical protein
MCTPWNRTFLLWVGLPALLAGCFALGTALGQAGGIERLLQGVQQAPAPDWVKPGVRLTYLSAAAVVADADPFDSPGGAGQGYTQLTVVSADRAASIVAIRSYNFSGFTGPCVAVGAASNVGPPGVAADWWVHPAVLRQVQDGKYGDMIVMRQVFTLKGKNYRVVRFHTEDRRHRFARMYDEETGILLRGVNAVAGRREMITHYTLEGTRIVRVPWTGAPTPPWVANTASLDYTSQQLQPIPGMRPVTRSGTARIAFQRRGPDWLQYVLSIQLGGIPPAPPTNLQSELVTGSSQFGGLWIPTNALAALQPGQVLDQDPFTKFTIQVSQVLGDQVVVSEISQLQRMDMTYDKATGLMVQYVQTDRHLQNSQTSLRYAGRQNGQVPMAAAAGMPPVPVTPQPVAPDVRAGLFDDQVNQGQAQQQRLPAGIDPAQTSTDPTYGYNLDNPIKVGFGPAAEHEYLGHLRSAAFRPFRFQRVSSASGKSDEHMVDKYTLVDEDGKTYTLYLDMYHKEAGVLGVKAPKGMYFQK